MSTFIGKNGNKLKHGQIRTEHIVNSKQWASTAQWLAYLLSGPALGSNHGSRVFSRENFLAAVLTNSARLRAREPCEF